MAQRNHTLRSQDEALTQACSDQSASEINKPKHRFFSNLMPAHDNAEGGVKHGTTMLGEPDITTTSHGNVKLKVFQKALIQEAIILN